MSNPSSKDRSQLIEDVRKVAATLNSKWLFDVARRIEGLSAETSGKPARDADHCDFPDCERHNTLTVQRLRAALERIAKWEGEFPSTGRTWDDGSPMSYAACFGSNGERDFIRQIARVALEQTQFQDETEAPRDTGILDTNGARLAEGDRVRVEWTAELGVTELYCEAVGTVAYMPDKITAAWFVQFDTPFRRSVGPEGLYESESQMLLQEHEIGDECLIHFTRLPLKSSGEVAP